MFQINQAFNEIVIFVLDCEIGYTNKEKLISIASYARFFLASVIPESYDRVLYLDYDTIIMDTLVNLWKIDLDGFMVAGVQDTVDKYFLKKIGLTQNDLYVNAGIILINLSLWRSHNLEQKFMDFIKKYDGNVPHHDQGTINAVCNKKNIQYEYLLSTGNFRNWYIC